MMSPRTLLAPSLALAALAAVSSAQVPYEMSSHYVSMRDGTKLAVDVYLPVSREPEEQLPALFELTRYWRSRESTRSGQVQPLRSPLDLGFLEHGYALVKVDVRGSGASFGTRPIEYGPEEVMDGWDLIDWVVQRDWSNGRVGAYGVSYSGTTAELLCACKHPALDAVIPGWSDFDLYRSPARPYGLLATRLIQQWSHFVGMLDDNDPRMGGQVRRVDGDEDGRLRAAAVAEHADNPEVLVLAREAEFRDRRVGKHSMAETSSLHWREEIEESGVPMLVFASWLDAGTAGGALHRFRLFANPQKLVILGSMHGGGAHASPYTVTTRQLPSVPGFDEQFGWQLDFLDHHLRGSDNGVSDWPAIRYFNLGEEALRETEVWPPSGTTPRRYHFQADGGLATAKPTSADGADHYEVDFSASTGAANRWMTQMGRPVLGLHDRGEMDERMLVYTSAPLDAPLQITGAPSVSLHIRSNRTDGTFLVYLEDVDEQGQSRYVTEGGLRAIHRKPGTDPLFGDSVHHSFNEADALPLIPGEETRLAFELWPTSVRIAAGHSLRVAIAGADAETFDRFPSEGDVKIEVARRRDAASWIELPVVDAAED